VKSPAEGAGGWFDPFSHEKPDRALSLVSLFSASRDAPTWSESGISRVPQVSPSHGMEDTQPLRAYVNPIEWRHASVCGASDRNQNWVHPQIVDSLTEYIKERHSDSL